MKRSAFTSRRDKQQRRTGWIAVGVSLAFIGVGVLGAILADGIWRWLGYAALIWGVTGLIYAVVTLVRNSDS
jgi:MFS family permease